MIVWSGNGIYAMIIMLCSLVFPLVGADELTRAFKLDAAPCYFGAMFIGLFAGGLICFLLGRKWNRNANFGEYHTLYFMRVEHWGITLLILASLMVVLPIVGWIVHFFIRHH
jgi:hypothetical protein